MNASSLILQKLLHTLKILPPHWRIVPVNHSKQPLGYSWQQHPFSPLQMISSLTHRGSVAVLGKARQPYYVIPPGIGLLCGQTETEFLLALDIDGNSAMALVDQLSRGQGLPSTVAFTSGREARAQYLFTLPSFSKMFKSRRIITAPGEALELRGEGHQSVLPPSPHPLTGHYLWINGPDTTPVAPAPDWVVELLSRPQVEPHPSQGFKTIVPVCDRKSIIVAPSRNTCATSITLARLLLEVIHPHYADNYQSWIFIGMALKYISHSLLSEWDTWSQLSSKYHPGECQYKWESFRGFGITDRTLHYYALHS
ncbi:bifunctional DNA primase/polymerase [Floridanema aerugineum]|uniref:Bifunctional DNA primase/polymerase n=1 Tax=Floridaenema aerugineum BLCC-F46 TaxID=3153654 RepID=A0ABV4X4T3_9CYAN